MLLGSVVRLANSQSTVTGCSQRLETDHHHAQQGVSSLPPSNNQAIWKESSENACHRLFRDLIHVTALTSVLLQSTKKNPTHRLLPEVWGGTISVHLLEHTHGS
jgi:hypothetical protein